MSVMLPIWLCVFGWHAYEAKTIGRQIEQERIKETARQLLAVLQPLVEQPKTMLQVVKKLENIGNANDAIGGPLCQSAHLQVWKAHTIVYTTLQLPTNLPTITEGGSDATLPVENFGLSWTEADTASGLTVRVVQSCPSVTTITPLVAVFYFFPVLVSFPFLLFPAWFIIKVGLRPLNDIVREIEERSATSLSPLGTSKFKELSPLVGSVNQLMERLAGRLAREREFLSDAAHELKTPLAIIQVNADSLLNNLDNRSHQRIREASNGLRQGVSRATHTVHQLLKLARSSVDHGREELQPIDLVEVLRDCIALADHLAFSRAIDIELQAPESCCLPLHRESVTALIDNLIDNAIKYSFDRGHIVVRVTDTPHGTQLAVYDEGSGIPEDLRKKVFERFFRLPGQDQIGSGLGLAIVEKAAARNDAHVRLDLGLNGKGLAVIVDFGE
jgi:two-component system sensor histidine kinase QseC